MKKGLKAVIKDKGGSDLIEISFEYPGSGNNLKFDIAGTKLDYTDAIVDTKSRIVHLHVKCSSDDFKVLDLLSHFSKEIR